MEVYLDNSATTKPLAGVVDAMTEVLTKKYGNPSSIHNKGLEAEKIVKNARKTLADKLGVKDRDIIFTSGGTEANNLAIRGVAYKYSHRGKHLITTEIEHKAVLETFHQLEKEGFEVTYLPTDNRGIISLTDLKEALREETILVSIMHVNNETGSIQPVARAGELIKSINRQTFFHVDGVQSLGKIQVKPAEWNIDMFTVSGHKIHGPKGIGALFIKNEIEIKPIITGGGQEGNLRSGTENVPGIAGLTPAVKALPDLNSDNNCDKKLARLKNYFLKNFRDQFPGGKVNTPKKSAPHIASISLSGIKGEVMVHALAGKGIYISTGSACHSNTGDDSHVLRAISLNPEQIAGTLRISFSHYNKQKDIDYLLETLQEQTNLLF